MEWSAGSRAAMYDRLAVLLAAAEAIVLSPADRLLISRVGTPLLKRLWPFRWAFVQPGRARAIPASRSPWQVSSLQKQTSTLTHAVPVSWLCRLLMIDFFRHSKACEHKQTGLGMKLLKSDASAALIYFCRALQDLWAATKACN